MFINTNPLRFDGNIQTSFLTVFSGTVLPKEGLLQNLNENIFVHYLYTNYLIIEQNRNIVVGY